MYEIVDIINNFFFYCISTYIKKYFKNVKYFPSGFNVLILFRNYSINDILKFI